MSTVNNAREEISRAYNAVRDDSDETNWLVLKHRGTQIVVDSTGSSFSDFESKFTDDERAFGFIRIVTGDEMSKRAKFAFITWIGSQVGILKKAKMSTDIAEVKELIRNFAVELHLGEKEELEESHIREKLTKAGGANYGTGQ